MRGLTCTCCCSAIVWNDTEWWDQASSLPGVLAALGGWLWHCRDQSPQTCECTGSSLSSMCAYAVVIGYIYDIYVYIHNVHYIYNRQYTDATCSWTPVESWRPGRSNVCPGRAPSCFASAPSAGTKKPVPPVPMFCWNSSQASGINLVILTRRISGAWNKWPSHWQLWHKLAFKYRHQLLRSPRVWRFPKKMRTCGTCLQGYTKRYQLVMGQNPGAIVFFTQKWLGFIDVHPPKHCIIMMKIITFIITLIIKTLIIVITYCSLSLSLAYLRLKKKQNTMIIRRMTNIQ